MHIETTVNPVRVICESRHLKALIVFSQAEFHFVVHCTYLSANEKIIWLILAYESMGDEAFVDCYRKGQNPFSPPLETFPVPLTHHLSYFAE